MATDRRANALDPIRYGVPCPLGNGWRRVAEGFGCFGSVVDDWAGCLHCNRKQPAHLGVLHYRPDSSWYHHTALRVKVGCFDIGAICADVVGILQ